MSSQYSNHSHSNLKDRAQLKRILENIALQQETHDYEQRMVPQTLVSYADSSAGSLSSDKPASALQSTMAHCFNTMSPEILKCVFELLPTKGNQLNMLLLSHKTYKVLCPLFYHRVSIDLTKPQVTDCVSKLLAPSNQGLEHITEIECVYPSQMLCLSKEFQKDVLRAAYILVKDLPEHQLNRFEWPKELPLPSAYTIIIWEKQTKLQNLEFWNHTWIIGSKLYKQAEQALRALNDVNDLRLCPKDVEGLQAWLVLKNRNIRSLELNLSQLELHPGNGEHDRSIAEQLFRHLMPLDKLLTPRHHFTRLNLSYVDMYLCKDTWLKAIDVSALSDLELIQCSFSDRFLKGLANTEVQLRRFVMRFNFDRVYGIPMDVYTIGALEELLNTMSPGTLKTLQLCLTNHRSILDAKAIGRHAMSIEQLDLDIWTVQIRAGIMASLGSPVGLMEIHDLLKHASPCLNQLALHFGPFESGISETLTHLFNCLKAISKYCCPKVLYISGFPSLLTFDSESDDFRFYGDTASIANQSTVKQLEDFVMRFFQSQNTLGERFKEVWPDYALGSKCRVLGIGAASGDADSAKYFVRADRSDAHPKSATLAELIRMGGDVEFLRPVRHSDTAAEGMSES